MGAAVLVMAGAIGCVPSQTVTSDSNRMVTSTPAAMQLGQRSGDGGVRIEAIQRYDSQSNEAVTGVVTVRNTSGAPRTIDVGVTWFNGEGRPLYPSDAVRETVTLGPRESRELVFRGEQGSRDFKVALNSAAQ